MRRIAATVGCSLVSLILLTPAPSAMAASCRFQLGFASIATALAPSIGSCLDDEAHNVDNGDAIQHTTGGLLVWRKSDNWTAFTDGYRTWVHGPHGVVERLNSQRFPWEANPDHLTVVQGSTSISTSTSGSQVTSTSNDTVTNNESVVNSTSNTNSRGESVNSTNSTSFDVTNTQTNDAGSMTNITNSGSNGSDASSTSGGNRSSNGSSSVVTSVQHGANGTSTTTSQTMQGGNTSSTP